MHYDGTISGYFGSPIITDKQTGKGIAINRKMSAGDIEKLNEMYPCQPTPNLVGIDKCAIGAHQCDRNAQCVYTNGGYNCVCKTGYEGNGRTCNDINECSSGTHDCDRNSRCQNTIGGFTCHCNSGFTGSGHTCRDIDECATTHHQCGRNAHCVNTNGSYDCACNYGYEGDGRICDDINDCGRNLCDGPQGPRGYPGKQGPTGPRGLIGPPGICG